MVYSNRLEELRLNIIFKKEEISFAKRKQNHGCCADVLRSYFLLASVVGL
jgi:hypothetical protein